MRHTWLGVVLAVALCAPATGQAAAAYRLQSSVTLKGAAPGWDYLTYDADRGYLFLGRRKDGVTVVDSASGQVVGKVENSEGANVAALAPELGRGFTANGDGSTTIFDLKTLKAVERVKLGVAADAAFFDPATRQVVFTLGDSKELVFVDGVSGRISARLPMPAEELEGLVIAGDGTLFVNERDLNKLAHVDLRTHRLLAEWSLPGCEMPTGLAMDPATRRLFVGCKGDHPVLAVVDAVTGKVVATPEIGRGNDGVVFDARTKRVFTANGVDANIVIFDQLSADVYRLAMAITTRPIARTLALDPVTGRLFTMTAEGMVDPSRPVNRRAGAFYPNRFFDDTFTLLTYAPQ